MAATFFFNLANNNLTLGLFYMTPTLKALSNILKLKLNYIPDSTDNLILSFGSDKSIKFNAIIGLIRSLGFDNKFADFDQSSYRLYKGNTHLHLKLYPAKGYIMLLVIDATVHVNLIRETLAELKIKYKDEDALSEYGKYIKFNVANKDKVFKALKTKGLEFNIRALKTKTFITIKGSLLKVDVSNSTVIIEI